MKLFVDCQLFDKGFQGTRTYLEGLYKELIKNKNIKFYLASKNPENLKKVFGVHTNVTYLNYQSSNPIYRLLIDIPYLLLKYHIDYAHFQYRVPPLKVCKYIVTIHDVLFEDYPEYFSKAVKLQSFSTFKMGAKMSDIIFTVSDYSKHQIEKHLSVKNVHVHPNGVQDVFFEDYNKEKIKNEVQNQFGFHQYLLYISRIEPRKKHDLLLHVFIENKLYEKYHLVFVGTKTYENHLLNSLYDSLAPTIQKKVCFLEHLSNNQLLDIIRGADISIYPSVAEGFGIPPLETIASCVPTLCSNQTAMSDFTFLNQSFFNPHNPKELSQKLIEILKHGDKEINEKRKYIANKYNWKNSAEIFYKVIVNHKQ